MAPALAYRDVIETEGLRLASIAEGNLDTTVDTCPDHDVGSLVGHVGEVLAFAAAQVRAADPSTVTPLADAHRHAGGEDVLAWYRARLDDLLAALDEAGTDRQVWTFGDDTTAGFYHRRMAHEISVHTWDCDRAVHGDASRAIPPDIAADGIDEIVEVGITRRFGSDDAPTGSLHLHATDGDGEWLITVVDGAPVLTHEHAKGDAAVRGPVSDLLLYLWGRGRGGCEVFGDEVVAEQWSRLAP